MITELRYAVKQKPVANNLEPKTLTDRIIPKKFRRRNWLAKEALNVYHPFYVGALCHGHVRTVGA